MNCTLSEIDSLVVKLELYESTVPVFKLIHKLGRLGSEKNLFQYWKQNLKKDCTSDSSNLFEEAKLNSHSKTCYY